MTTVDPDTLEVPVTVKVVPAAGSTWIFEAVEKIAVEFPWMVIAAVDLMRIAETVDTIAVDCPDMMTVEPETLDVPDTTNVVPATGST